MALATTHSKDGDSVLESCLLLQFKLLSHKFTTALCLTLREPTRIENFSFDVNSSFSIDCNHDDDNFPLE